MVFFDAGYGIAAGRVERWQRMAQLDTEPRRGPTACASCSLQAAWACV